MRARMSGLQVVEGGGGSGGGEDDNRRAVSLLQALCIDLMRLVGGGKHGYYATWSLEKFLQHCSTSKVQLGVVVEDAAAELYDRAFTTRGKTDRERQEVDLLHSAYQLILEDLATDNMANARRSKRENDFRSAFDQMVRDHERGSRENGWSYVEHVTRSLNKLPAPAPRRRAKSPKKSEPASD
jgi:hypothetical protein